MSERGAEDRGGLVQRVLRERFGFEGLRGVQGAVVDRVLGGGHALVVLPTGSGKSLCYQLPALVMAARRIEAGEAPGVCLVLSPLIALMEDQVSALRKKGVRAAYINSTLRKGHREDRMRRLRGGEFELMYATPERMLKEGFVEALLGCPGGVNLLAIDEAHCVSKWGHDLRPAYQMVGEFRERLMAAGGDRALTTIALTATATERVREDIRGSLSFDEAEMPLFATGVDRPNLMLGVTPCWDDSDKDRAIVRICTSMPGTKIVYYALIRDLERAADRLRKKLAGHRVDMYHGKLDPGRKKRVYDRFIEQGPEEGLVLLATNAFGMGVDKPDIRAIVHAQVPGSVEAYYQEVGRAGRDGLPSRCELLYSQDDLAIQQNFAEWANPSPDLLAQIAAVIEGDYSLVEDDGDGAGRRGDATFFEDDIRLRVLGRGRGDGRVGYALTMLAKLGVIEETGRPDEYRRAGVFEDSMIDPAAIEEKRRGDLARLLEMVKLTQTDNIAGFLRGYFALPGEAGGVGG